MDSVDAEEDEACPSTPERKRIRLPCAATPEKEGSASSSSHIPEPVGLPKALGPDEGDRQEHGESADVSASSVISGAPQSSRRMKPKPGNVVAITGPGRVKNESVLCTVTQCLDGDRVEVRMPSGELKEVPSGACAIKRKHLDLTLSKDLDDERGWCKVGSKQIQSSRVTWFGNWVTGEVMVIPDGCDSCIASPLLHTHVIIDLPPSHVSLASGKLRWAMEKVAKLAVEPGMRFKVGISANPPLRWEYYYAEDCVWTIAGVNNYAKYGLESAPAEHGKVSDEQVRAFIQSSGRVSKMVEFGSLEKATDRRAWSKMVVIGISNVSQEVAQIESAIILKYHGLETCANIAPGGEGSAMMRTPPFYVYICIR